MSPDGNGETNISGRFALTGLDCSSASCPIALLWMNVTGAPFGLGGETITRPAVFNTTIGTGTYFPDSGFLLIDVASLEVVASGGIGSDRRAVQATNGFQGVGLVNAESRLIRFVQDFSDGDIAFRLEIDGVIDNIRPTLNLDPVFEFECDGGGLGTVTVQATAADPDSAIAPNIDWFVNGIHDPTVGNVLSIRLPLGAHEVSARATDADGGLTTVGTMIEVVDSTPPTILYDDICLWPPNHKLHFLDTAQIAAETEDACGGPVDVEIVAGLSSEPPNDIGDGNTEPDIIIGDVGACIRAERSGPNNGRDYDLTVRAIDRFGNSTDDSVVVRVPHNAGQDRQCISSSPSLPEVSADDPLCERTTPLPVVPSDPNGEEGVQSSAGCSAAGATYGFLGWFLLALVGLSARRRRRR